MSISMRKIDIMSCIFPIFSPKKKKSLSFFLSKLYIVVAVVLIWRGIWYVLDEMDKLAEETFDESFSTAYDGQSKQFKESSSSLLFAFALAILLIYLILSAQFESFVDPIIIIFIFYNLYYT
jgi:Cu/Ag efflux pump CusA